MTHRVIQQTTAPLRRLSAAAAIACIAIAAACGTDPEDQEMTGVWAGTAGDVVIELTLNDTGTQVRGSGYLRAGQQTRAVSVTGGLRVERDISLTLSHGSGTDADAINFQGSFVDRGQVDGKLNGWVFTDHPMTLLKQ
jgi:hypothetical protein